jgi:hypothetical protein
MNDKIRELAEQSGFFPVPDETEVDLEYRAENARYERFVELIVGECVQLALVEKQRYGNMSHRNMTECAIAMDNYQLILKEYFGVE